MPQSGNIKQINRFTKGLITEASPLNFPDNASIDEENFVLHVDGTRSRRLGLDIELNGRDGLPLLNGNYTTTSSYYWKTVGLDNSLLISVIQFDNILYFFKNTGEALVSQYLGVVQLDGDGFTEYSYATVNGDLVVATGETDPVLITYSETEGLQYKYLKIKIRDFYGVEDGLDSEERPNVLTAAHNYNLRNQGWPFEFTLGGPSTGDPVEAFNTDLGLGYPSHFDHFQYGITPLKNDPESEKFKPELLKTASVGSSYSPKGRFIIDPFYRGQSRKDQVSLSISNGTTVTRSFHLDATCTINSSGWLECSWTAGSPPSFVLNSTADALINLDLSIEYPYTLVNDAVNGWTIQLQGDPIVAGFVFNDTLNVSFQEVGTTTVLDIPEDIETGKISCVASSGNRVFYSGIQSNILDGDDKSVKYDGAVFFSKTASTADDLEKCYQEADPTSRKISDLVDTDGGVIFITEAKGIQALIPIGSSLVVVAENGIWAISGTDRGFLATEYIVKKISDIGSEYRRAITKVDGGLFYWSSSAIYYVAPNQYGELRATNITETTIKSLVLTIDNPIGFYDVVQAKVFWLYADGTQELVFDLNLQAFYKNSFPQGYLRGYVETPKHTLSFSSSDVYVGTDLVFDGSSEVVEVQSVLRQKSNVSLKYITEIAGRLYFSELSSESFLDFEEHDYTSYLITGYDTTGDVISKKTSPYIFFYFARTEDGYEYDENLNLSLKHKSACKLQTRWDWTDSPNSGKWGIQSQVYRLLKPYTPSGIDDPFDYGDSVVITKNRILGRGRALSMKLSSESGKDMHLLGWSTVTSGTTAP